MSNYQQLGVREDNSFLGIGSRPLKIINERYEEINEGDYVIDLDYSKRQGFIINVTTNITINLRQPKSDKDIIDSKLVFCCEDAPRAVNITINSLSNNNIPYDGSFFTLMERLKIYKKNGTSIESSDAGIKQGSYVVVDDATFQADIFINVWSCGKSPSENYLYQAEIEQYNV